jgi:hypothetical protein
MKGKVEKVVKQTFVDNNGNEYYSVTIDGKQGNYACKGGKTPYFIEGQELEYEEETKPDKNGNPRTKFKKPYNPNGFGGGKKQTMPLSECKRIAKSNAVHAVILINKVKQREHFKGDVLGSLVAFSLGEIKGDIDKWGTEHSDFISRLAALSNAAEAEQYKGYETVEQVIEYADKLYKYVIG